MSDAKGEVIVGVTSEIGRALARELAKNNNPLVIAGRNSEELEIIAEDLRIRGNVPVTPLVLNVTDFEAHPAFLEACLQSVGHVAGITLCQGYMAEQREAETNWQQTKEMIDVNFASAVSLANLFAQHMAANGNGYICGISSVAGDRGRQSNFLYGATKAAFSAYLQGLRNRLYSKGVAVITVKPGFVDTAMTWGLLNPRSPLVAPPERVARDIARAIRKRKNVLYTPWFWAYIMWIIRTIPESIFKRLSL